MKKLHAKIVENGIEYHLVGDYYIPNFRLQEEDRTIGKYGSFHRKYLQEYKGAFYSSLVISGQIYSYLADLNEQAEKRLEIIVEQMKWQEGVTEQLKADSQMEWVRRMQGIYNRAEEIVLRELVYI